MDFYEEALSCTSLQVLARLAGISTDEQHGDFFERLLETEFPIAHKSGKKITYGDISKYEDMNKYDYIEYIKKPEFIYNKKYGNKF